MEKKEHKIDEVIQEFLLDKMKNSKLKREKKRANEIYKLLYQNKNGKIL